MCTTEDTNVGTNYRSQINRFLQLFDVASNKYEAYWHKFTSITSCISRSCITRSVHIEPITYHNVSNLLAIVRVEVDDGMIGKCFPGVVEEITVLHRTLQKNDTPQVIHILH